MKLIDQLNSNPKTVLYAGERISEYLINMNDPPEIDMLNSVAEQFPHLFGGIAWKAMFCGINYIIILNNWD